MSKHMLFFGFGFCASALMPVLAAQDWRFSATCRDKEKADALRVRGVSPLLLGDDALDDMDDISHILLSAPPSENGDPALPILSDALAGAAAQLQWIGYLSTTGVYGDHGGAWIDEETPSGSISARGQRRVDAEAAWASFAALHDLPLHYFRLAGIYGSGRNQLAALKNGTARRIDKKGQVFSRIHVDDIATILHASIARPNPGRAYSVCDDEPAPPQDVVAFAAALLGQEPPPLIAFEQADLSPMAQSFYAENKRIKNQRLKDELGVALAYPSYREGLRALFEAGAF